VTYRFLPPAVREVREAAHYYEARVPGLGFDFLAEVRAAVRRMLAHPEAWCPLDNKFRRCRTARFPYGLIYTVEADHILVVSVMHLHRHPDAWRMNLGSALTRRPGRCVSEKYSVRNRRELMLLEHFLPNTPIF
jgi:hypothetical protein